MIDAFRDWINTILSIGIIFTVFRLITPNTKLKNYIYSLIGIVTIVVLFSPIISTLKKGNIDDYIKQISSEISANNIDNTQYVSISNYENVGENNVKSELKNKLQEDIKEKIQNKISKDLKVNVSVDVSQEYNIKSVVISINQDIAFDIANYISLEYGIERNIIQVIKGG